MTTAQVAKGLRPSGAAERWRARCGRTRERLARGPGPSEYQALTGSATFDAVERAVAKMFSLFESCFLSWLFSWEGTVKSR